jgi:hypothetical protein
MGLIQVKVVAWRLTKIAEAGVTLRSPALK